mmetsp:Transcript_47870/g.154366  ORF Transcript_47870/g.154366 Transcript_47870/m.154366 type:complete len:419 (-) Transcript_47870:1374-2630(-)
MLPPATVRMDCLRLYKCWYQLATMDTASSGLFALGGRHHPARRSSSGRICPSPGGGAVDAVVAVPAGSHSSSASSAAVTAPAREPAAGAPRSWAASSGPKPPRPQSSSPGPRPLPGAAGSAATLPAPEDAERESPTARNAVRLHHSGGDGASSDAAPSLGDAAMAVATEGDTQGGAQTGTSTIESKAPPTQARCKASCNANALDLTPAPGQTTTGSRNGNEAPRAGAFCCEGGGEEEDEDEPPWSADTSQVQGIPCALILAVAATSSHESATGPSNTTRTRAVPGPAAPPRTAPTKRRKSAGSRAGKKTASARPECGPRARATEQASSRRRARAPSKAIGAEDSERKRSPTQLCGPNCAMTRATAGQSNGSVATASSTATSSKPRAEAPRRSSKMRLNNAALRLPDNPSRHAEAGIGT